MLVKLSRPEVGSSSSRSLGCRCRRRGVSLDGGNSGHHLMICEHATSPSTPIHIYRPPTPETRPAQEASHTSQPSTDLPPPLVTW